MMTQEIRNAVISDWLSDPDLHKRHEFGSFALAVTRYHDQRIVDRLKRYDILSPSVWTYYAALYLDKTDSISPEDAEAIRDLAVAHRAEGDSMWDYHLLKTKVDHIVDLCKQYELDR